jgi:hypothetical protein
VAQLSDLTVDPVTYTGQVQVGDMRGAFPYQVQPRIDLVDYLVQPNPIQLPAAQGIQFDNTFGCAYAEPVRVPHNNRVTDGAATVIDRDLFLLSGLPSFNWSTFTTGAIIQNFPERPTANQKIEVHCASDGSAEAQTLDAVAGGFSLQGLRLQWTRSIFVPMDASTDAYFNIYATVSGYIVGVQTGTGDFVRVVLSTDGGATFQTVKADLKVANPQQIAGNTTPESAAGLNECEFRVMNGQLSIRVNGQSNPFVVNVAKKASSSTVSPGGTSALNLLPGTGAQFPAAPFTVYAYPPGAAPNGSNAVALNVTGVVGNSLICSGGGSAAVGARWTVALLNPLISQIEVKAASFTQLGLSAHPTKWRTAFSFDSQPHDAGFVPDGSTPPWYVVNTTTTAIPCNSGDVVAGLFPAGSTVQVTTDPDSLDTEEPAYTLVGANPYSGTYKGDDYADATIAVCRVQTRINAIVDVDAPDFVTFPLDETQQINIKGIQRSYRFDFNTMEMTQDATVTWDNWLGFDNWKAITGQGNGNCTMALRLGRADLDNSDPDGPGFAQGVYICQNYRFIRSKSNQKLLQTPLRDQNVQLQKRLVVAPPDLDGVYHYYAMQQWAEYGGITPYQMAFFCLDASGNLFQIEVPDDPYAPDPRDPDPYFLPTGIGMRPWTPVNRQLNVLQLMSFVQQLSGLVRYFDPVGLLTYTPFVLPDPSAPVRIFTEYDDGANAFRGLTVDISTEETRNQVVTIGIDEYAPDDRAIITKFEDTDSISAAAGARPTNYLGFPSPLIWMDSRFAVQGFASKTALRLFNLVRQPTYEASFTCWPQPDLAPLDVIYVNDTSSPIYGVPLYIMDISHNISRYDELTQESHIRARFIDYSALGGS